MTFRSPTVKPFGFLFVFLGPELRGPGGASTLAEDVCAGRQHLVSPSTLEHHVPAGAAVPLQIKKVVSVHLTTSPAL